MTHTPLRDNPLHDHTAAVRQIMQLVDVAASRRATVVVAGDSETGPETIARAIHIRGDRADGALVKIDCSKLSADELEQELFGIAVRAGRGGTTDGEDLEPFTRGSRIYQALGGTLLLEHAARLSASVQARLVRVLNHRSAMLEPARQRVPVNVRLVLAADREFDLACRDGHIRAELHSSPSTLRITLPEMQVNGDDVPVLASHLLEDACREANVQRKELTSLAQILLTAMVRRRTALELRFLLEGLVTRVRDRVIRVEDLLANLLVDDEVGPLGTAASLRDAREQFERKYIMAVIQRHHGRIPHAARALGIQRANLYRKLRHLDVSPDNTRSAIRRDLRSPMAKGTHKATA
jgi:two-component system nitrogen regulation response regulator NtrX